MLKKRKLAWGRSSLANASGAPEAIIGIAANNGRYDISAD
jgi:hypothetical protein